MQREALDRRPPPAARRRHRSAWTRSPATTSRWPSPTPTPCSRRKKTGRSSMSSTPRGRTRRRGPGRLSRWPSEKWTRVVDRAGCAARHRRDAAGRRLVAQAGVVAGLPPLRPDFPMARIQPPPIDLADLLGALRAACPRAKVGRSAQAAAGGGVSGQGGRGPAPRPVAAFEVGRRLRRPRSSRSAAARLDA